MASHLKVGVEIEVAVPRGSNRETFHSQLLQAFQPSKDYHHLGRYGIYGVEVEHCGIEIQVIGTHPYYPSLLRQYERIVKILFELQARTKATCGLHFHFLCDHLIDPLPEVIFANLWNCIRFFAAELKFLTSAGERPRGICRRRNHNSHLEIVKWEASPLPVHKIQKYLRESKQVPEHQNFFNLEHLDFNENGDISILHYELRFPDADLCPTSIVTKIFLCTSLLFRAVELSRFGIVVIEDQDLWKTKLAILDKLSNNEGTLAESDTTLLDDEDYEKLRDWTGKLIRFLRPSLLRFPNNPSLKVLEFLIEYPISSLRSRDWSWEDISTVLSWIGRINREDFRNDLQLEQMIEFNELSEFPSPTAWKKTASVLIGVSPEQIERSLFRINTICELIWDKILGGFIFRS